MKFSKRIQSIQPSITLAIEATTRTLKAEGKDIISFGAGEPDFGTPENIKQRGITAINNNDTHYTPVGGTDALKEAILQKFLNENNLSYEKNQIVVSCGAKHSFYNLAQVLWEEGDEVLIPSPYWVSYPEIVTLTGAKPVILKSTLDMEYKILPEQIDEAANSRTRALILNSPSNPTGSAYTAKELEALAEAALRHDLLIVMDEIYEKIVFDDFRPTSIASISREVQQNCVVINGVSKGYAMTGWRIGYLAVTAEIAAQCNKLQSQCTSNPSSISQAASIEALTGPQDEVNKMVVEFQNRRNALLEGLLKLPGVTCYRPVGTFYSFPDFSQNFEKSYRGKSVEGSLKFTEFLLKEAQVALVPGIAFGADANARMAFAASLENIQKGLERIGNALDLLQ